MARQRRNWGWLDEMCAMLDVSESGYRSWQCDGKPGRKRLTDAQMLALIQSILAEFKGAYGSPPMVRELRSRGFPASKRLMQENDIRDKQLSYSRSTLYFLHPAANTRSQTANIPSNSARVTGLPSK